MGGKIWIESELGKGATFAFTVRVTPAPVKEYMVPDWNSIRMLAIDDDAITLEYFREIVERFGASCDTVLNGEDARKITSENETYDFYFVDYMLPDIDGIELVRELREKRTDAGKGAMIMISAVEWSVIEEKAKRAGVEKFLAKPIFPSDVVDAVNGFLGIDKKKVEEKREIITQQFKGRRILLAEDVDINREIVLTLLEPTLIDTDCAEDGEQAVSMFSASPDKYDMIFMDVQMPEMDGYEATRAIRALDIPRAGTVPIIAMTANVFREDVEKCLDAGMNAHVGKPLDINEVVSQLRQYLKKG